MTNQKAYWCGALLLFLPELAAAGVPATLKPLDLTHHWAGYASLIGVIVGYVAAMLEDVSMLRKSKPMLLAASSVWVVIALAYRGSGLEILATDAFKANLQAYMELLLFIMVSMTYLNVMEDMGLFDLLRARLVAAGFRYRTLFWITGVLVFLLSGVVNGLTSGLLMGAVVVAVGKDNPRFVSLACINIVVACNAGGTFSPIGGISTLFVWQKGVVEFTHFFKLFLPCVVNFAIPAFIMNFAVPAGAPRIVAAKIEVRRGAGAVIALFGVTVGLAVGFDMFLHLPPAAGMMGGLSLLALHSFFLQRSTFRNAPGQTLADPDVLQVPELDSESAAPPEPTIFDRVARLDWDTLLYFAGAMLGIGGLGFIGYLDAASAWLYGGHDAALANILIGLSSAFVDNGTLMFAVLSMKPAMSESQWLLLTLTLGVGGSLLAIGSAPGIGLLGLTRGRYSFVSHLRWCPVILLGYFAAIGVHYLVNSEAL